MGRHGRVALTLLLTLAAPRAAWSEPPWKLTPVASRSADDGQGAAGDAAVAVGDAVRVVKLSGAVGEAAAPWDPFGFDRRVVLSDALAAVDDLASDPEVGTLVVKVRTGDLGQAQARDLARALREAREAGKHVVAHAVEVDAAALVVATAADEFLMTPEGMVVAPGVRAEVTFYKDLLDAVGVEADIETMGRYKSAAEPLTRRDMSGPAREALEALVDGIWDTLLDDVAAQRGIPRDKVRALFDLGMMSAEDARRHGLVDDLAYWPDTLERLARDSGETPALAYPEPVEVPDLTSFLGVIRLLSQVPGDGDGDGARIALLAAEGPIVLGRAADSIFSRGGVVGSSDVLDAIEAIEEDDGVRAVVVRIDSPGGSALASDLVWRALHDLAKDRPVVASLGNTAASGGYYVASAARHVVAEPSTITGSIGVFGGKLVLDGLYDKLGLDTVVISRGKHAGLFSTQQRFSDSERRVIRAHMKRTYDTFVNRVARGRGMSYDAVHRVAQGRVWCGRDAVDRGLVDALGGLGDAVTKAAEMAGVDPERVHLESYPRPKSFMEMLRSRSASLRAAPLDLGRLGALLPGAVGGEILRAATLIEHLLSREVALAMMPYRVKLR
ncbi:MAG: signal peptide peptidase SppA [Myxococcota bacterium]